MEIIFGYDFAKKKLKWNFIKKIKRSLIIILALLDKLFSLGEFKMQESSATFLICCRYFHEFHEIPSGISKNFHGIFLDLELRIPFVRDFCSYFEE